jgi:hypothetical protein
MDGMKTIKTLPIHIRAHASDLIVIDQVAAEELSTRSGLISRIIHDWVRKQQMPPKK